MKVKMLFLLCSCFVVSGIFASASVQLDDKQALTNALKKLNEGAKDDQLKKLSLQERALVQAYSRVSLSPEDKDEKDAFDSAQSEHEALLAKFSDASPIGKDPFSSRRCFHRLFLEKALLSIELQEMKKKLANYEK